MSQALRPSQADTVALVALGSNAASAAGGAKETVLEAISALKMVSGRVVGVSQLFETPCFPAGAGPDFVNGAVAMETALSAKDLLKVLHGIEADFGRKRVTRWGQRTLDLDLVAYGDAVLPDLKTFSAWLQLDPDSQAKEAPDQLILPHPRVQDRGFVLVPLAQVAPDWVHPVLNRSISQMLGDLDPAEIRDIRPLG